MTVLLTCFVPGVPIPQGSKNAFMPKGATRPVIVDVSSKDLKAWRKAVGMLAKAHCVSGCPTPDAVAIRAIFYMPRPAAHYGTGKNAGTLRPAAPKTYHAQTPDLDKCLRAIGDALTGVVYVDDKQVAEIRSRKVWADRGKEGVGLTVESVEEVV